MASMSRPVPQSRWHKLRYDPGGKAVLVGLLLGIALSFVSLTASFYMVSYAWIRSEYGNTAYQAGLRVTDNKGTLSNGDKLSGLGQLAVYSGSFVIGAPLPMVYFVWYRRWADQSYTRYEHG
jgi:hypothetical protein